VKDKRKGNRVLRYVTRRGPLREAEFFASSFHAKVQRKVRTRHPEFVNLFRQRENLSSRIEDSCKTWLKKLLNSRKRKGGSNTWVVVPGRSKNGTRGSAVLTPSLSGRAQRKRCLGEGSLARHCFGDRAVRRPYRIGKKGRKKACRPSVLGEGQRKRGAV